MPPPARGGADAATRHSAESDNAEEDEEAAVPAAHRAPPRLVRSPPLNPAVVRAQRAEEVLQLKLEFLTDSELTAVMAITYLAVFAAWLLLGVLFLVKARRTPLYYANGQGTRGNTIFNVVLGSALLAGVSAVAAYSGARLYRLRVLRRLRWADDSRRLATAQRQVLIYAFLLNCVFFLAPNAYALARPCALFAPLVTWCQVVRWLCLNVIFADIALLAWQCWRTSHAAADQEDSEQHGGDDDGGGGGAKTEGGEARRRVRHATQLVRAAAPLAVVFVTSIGVVIAAGVVSAGDVRTEQLEQVPCRDPNFVAECKRRGLLLSPVRRWLYNAHALLVAMYAVLFCAYVTLAWRRLRRHSYAASRRRRVALRFLVWSTAKALLTAVAAVALFLVVDAASCETRALTDYGVSPLQLVLGVYVAVHGYVLAPATAAEERRSRVLLEQLQAYAWREEERDGVAALRNAGCPPALWAEPVFVVETALKLFSWSWAAYERGALAGADLRGAAGDAPPLFVRPLGPRLRPGPLPGDVPLQVEVAALRAKRATPWHRLRTRLFAAASCCVPAWEREAAAIEAARRTRDGAEAEEDEERGGGTGWDPRDWGYAAASRAGSWATRAWGSAATRARALQQDGIEEGAGESDSEAADEADGAAHAGRAAAAAEEEKQPKAADAVADAALAAVVLARREARRRRGAALLPRLLALYGQRHAWVFAAPRRDVKALLAWGGDSGTVLLAFRGSASAENFRTDAQFALVSHPPRRRAPGPLLPTAALLARPLRSRTPSVHSGFWRAYTGGGLRRALLAQLAAVLSARGGSSSGGQQRHAPVRVLCTGHSLGGALAILAAYDVAAACRLPPGAVSVYTFGCPRVGNHAFAADFDAAVPDCWNVVLGRDAVFRGAKFGALYKHPGKRVHLKREGLLLVRPTFIETSFSRGGGALGDHLLRRYLAAWERLLRAEAEREPEAAPAMAELRQELLYLEDVFPAQEQQGEQAAQQARAAPGAAPQARAAPGATPPEAAVSPAHGALQVT